jgi:hypothetical protein
MEEVWNTAKFCWVNPLKSAYWKDREKYAVVDEYYG